MRHPDYDGRLLTMCAEEAPDLHGFGITFACTKQVEHHCDHEATIPGGVVLVRWPR